MLPTIKCLKYIYIKVSFIVRPNSSDKTLFASNILTKPLTNQKKTSYILRQAARLSSAGFYVTQQDRYVRSIHRAYIAAQDGQKINKNSVSRRWCGECVCVSCGTDTRHESDDSKTMVHSASAVCCCVYSHFISSF